MLNPRAAILQQMRHALIDPTAPTAAQAAGGAHRLVIPAAILVGLLVLGLWYFNREAPRIAEERDLDVLFVPETGTLRAPGEAFFKSKKNNFQPRVSFSWTPGEAGRTVLRGGFGILVGPGQHADGLAECAVVGQWPVLLPVGAQQVRQHQRVAGVGLGTRDRVPVPVPVDGLRVDRIDPVTGRA